MPPLGATLVEERFLLNNRGQRLYTRTYIPPKPYSNVLLFLHGGHEHSGRYHWFFLDAIERGLAIYSIDYHGHGRSEGPRHDCKSFDEYLDDINLVTDQMHADHASESVKYFVSGISFGGLFAAHISASGHHTWDGVVLVAPAIDVETSWLMSVQRKFADLLVLLMPTASIVPAIPKNEMTRDKKAIEEFDADPLVHHGPLKMRLCWVCLQGMKSLTTERRAAIKAPLLVLHGTADKATSPKLSKLFFDQVGSTIKTYHALPDQLHLLLHELEKKDNARLIFDWILNLEQSSNQ
ncbi:unnamed protein product [Aphanomyces euteiches]|uniref:Serine aminopeptidase S33 domain-containing protein n=1 Tax=Aphanomyces euteiches TaxID=100861 RepID=A0A6G0WQL7_9STRA|nr:hypothetical protein Ae201684_012741 [Aphanomyces euteiches]KAH9095586.1 hypothetical protein Ae201684P_015387 [Aphanomyces euteiches]